MRTAFFIFYHFLVHNRNLPDVENAIGVRKITVLDATLYRAKAFNLNKSSSFKYVFQMLTYCGLANTASFSGVETSAV